MQGSITWRSFFPEHLAIHPYAEHANLYIISNFAVHPYAKFDIMLIFFFNLNFNYKIKNFRPYFKKISGFKFK